MTDGDSPNYDELKKEQAERKARWLEENMALIDKSGFPYDTRNNGTILLFRIKGKPRVDFYPTTNRWRVAGNPKTMYGPAKRFLGWFRAQQVPIQETIAETVQPQYTHWSEVRAAAIKTKKRIKPVLGGWILE